MPTGPEAKLALFEAAGRLSNNGQHTDDPNQLAFGGMLTFLDTAAPPPSDDKVGPVATHISATPNPSNGLADVTVSADLSDATTGGSNVAQAEFVVDDAVATGPGFGTPMTGAFGTVDVANVSGTLPAGHAHGTGRRQAHHLRAGAGQRRELGRRGLGDPQPAQDRVRRPPAAGLRTSRPTGRRTSTISATGDDRAAGGTITEAEYFLDTAGRQRHRHRDGPQPHRHAWCRDRHHRRRRPCNGAGRRRAPRAGAQQGLARSVGSAARHRAGRRPDRTDASTRPRRPEPEQRRPHRQGQPRATCMVSAQITDPDAGRRRCRTPSSTPRRSSTRPATRRAAPACS